ncbi:hypothetical protein PYCCODRAFT_1371869 [Trametes coccinea BRFM310]|uniref:Uncharacterized protein n=1 Tax=Trametes coccinea (strain BRFM310) TaxID=1353009 RepID=A0A1Y2IJL1_TRAC3|nr:hypothetical protein PYCCODRAFT_1371869 [Trametes coccinea BRFM310]
MFAQYSPLFTSGLLSESNSPSSSRHSSIERRGKVPRGSLPVDANLDSFYETSTSEDDALFLTFMPRRRRADAGNSFLSLDLAESHSMRSMSLRRKDTVTTRATTHFGRSVPTSPTMPPMPTSPTMPFSFAHFGPSRQPHRPIVRHSSREGLPGAKPVPSTQPPAPPAAPKRRARPSDLTITLSTCFSVTSSSMPPSLHRPSQSEPSILSPVSPLLSPTEHSYLTFSPPTTPPATALLNSLEEAQRVSPASAPPEVPLRSRPSVRSTVSFRTRQVNRSAALAALEGRITPNSRSRPPSRPRNFMSMSDDEDDTDVEDYKSFPLPPTSAPVGPLPSSLLDVLQEEEDVVVPSPSASVRQKRSSTASSKRRSRRGTIESLLSPLANFIDFSNDDASTRSWRSFVEIS